MAAPNDSDHEHWPDNAKLAAVSAAPAPRYDNHNGLYEHTYRPAGVEVKAFAPTVPKQEQAAAPQYVQYVPYPQQQMGGQYMGYPPGMQYYGGYGGGAPYAGQLPPAYNYPAYNYTQPSPAKEDEKPAPKADSPRKWQGRTRAEVAEDDMKLAASQGAYAERKVQPVGLADDQVVWVVEVDQSTVLRTFAEVKEAKGEWKADPRFRDSWYFVREKEEGGEK